MTRTYWVICVAAATLAGCGAPDDGQLVTVRQSALVAYSEDCGTATVPDANHVMIWQNAHYAPPCRQLPLGFYPTPTNFGLPNDSISSFRVGSSVTVRFFKDATYGGGYETWYGGQYGDFDVLSSFNDQISSMRVMPNDGRQDCVTGNIGVQPGEIALFRDANFSPNNDCVILPQGNYPTPEDMGIANDSISSIINMSLTLTLDGDYDTWYGPPGLGEQVPPDSGFLTMSPDGFMVRGGNDRISSIFMHP
jgi:hypothetical protein